MHRSGLASAIDTLYEVFGAVPRPASVDGCPCCWLPSDASALLQPVPLRSLPALALAPYAVGVPFTVGSAGDFRHFLPRLLEVSVTEGFGGPDADFMAYPTIEPFLSRLRHTGWTTWAPSEQAAVRGFLDALWHDTLTTDPASSTFFADDVLCALGNAVDDITPFLAAWAALLPAPHPAAHLRELRAQPSVNAFWEDRATQHDQVTVWLTVNG
ncbi:hypothetical protein [Dactylosporangium sp. NPDC005555]|uniref:hypothetical protein n=1 Tax=Dactylosporangium sp. NPDC005555 TaxID=3154889 RepID=UPI0033A04F14